MIRNGTSGWKTYTGVLSTPAMVSWALGIILKTGGATEKRGKTEARHHAFFRVDHLFS